MSKEPSVIDEIIAMAMVSLVAILFVAVWSIVLWGSYILVRIITS